MMLAVDFATFPAVKITGSQKDATFAQFAGARVNSVICQRVVFLHLLNPTTIILRITFHHE
jgi:hypothetical protein